MVWSAKGQASILAFLAIYCGSAIGTFLAFFPTEFRPGWPLNVAVSVSNHNVSGKVFVDLSLGPKNDIVDVYNAVAGNLLPGETKNFVLPVPEIVLQPSTIVRLVVKATGAISFTEERDVQYNPTSSLVLVETDKAIYKPGQKVQFRVVHVDKDLRPIIKPLTVFILNPKDNKLEEFKNVGSRNGVEELTYELSQSASLGTWQIQVLDEAKMQFTKSFTVEEYVLPKFSVDVKANPGFIVLENKIAESVIAVEAKYTYGKGVQGKCVLTLSDGMSQIQYTKQLDHLGNGEFSAIEWTKLTEKHHGKELKISATATVTDETGRSEVGQAVVMVYKYNTKVEIMPQTTKVFRPGLPATLVIRVSDQAGNPVDNAQVEIEVKVNNMQHVHAKLTVPKGETVLTYKFTPEYTQDPSQTDANHMPQYRFSSGTIKVALMSNREVTAKSDAFLYRSFNGGVISVSSATDKGQVVGEEAVFNIVKHSRSTEDTIMNFLVVGQGNIILSGQASEGVVRFTPTLEMCPQAKLLAYMFIGLNKPEVVVDSIDFSPTRCFQKEVEVSFDASQVRVGSETTMKVQVSHTDKYEAAPGIHSVFYLAIDKSLALLQGRTELNQDQVLAGLSAFNLKNEAMGYRETVPHAAKSIIEDLSLALISTAYIEHDDQLIEYEDDYANADIRPYDACDICNLRIVAC